MMIHENIEEMFILAIEGIQSESLVVKSPEWYLYFNVISLYKKCNEDIFDIKQKHIVYDHYKTEENEI